MSYKYRNVGLSLNKNMRIGEFSRGQLRNFKKKWNTYSYRLDAKKLRGWTIFQTQPKKNLNNIDLEKIRKYNSSKIANLYRKDFYAKKLKDLENFKTQNKKIVNKRSYGVILEWIRRSNERFQNNLEIESLKKKLEARRKRNHKKFLSYYKKKNERKKE